MVRPIELKLDLELCLSENYDLHENIVKTFINKLDNYKKDYLNNILTKLKDPNLPTKEISKLTKHPELVVRLSAVGHPNIDKDVLKDITKDELRKEHKSVLNAAKRNLQRLDPSYSLA